MLSRYRSIPVIGCIFIRRFTHNLIDHTKYPLHNRQSVAYCQLVSNARQTFASSGCVYFPHFLTSHTLSTILNEVNSILTDSSQNIFHSFERHTINLYGTSFSGTPPSDMQWSSKSVIAFDQIPTESLLRRLYAWQPLVDFISDIVHIYPSLYRSCDELGALYVNVYRQSNQLNWHTDHSHFFVNLLLQQPSTQGEGVFEYKINGSETVIRRDDFQAGGLVLFNGRHNAHRVTEIQSASSSTRIGAILTFDPRQDHRLSDYVLRKFFGRTTTMNIN